MAYAKTTWSDRVVQYPRRYRDELNNQKTFTPDEGTIINTGTAVSAVTMNNIENELVFLDGNIPNFAVDTGSTNAYAMNLSHSPIAYTAGQIFNFKATNSNTGSSTLNVSSLGVKTIKKNGTSDLIANDILANMIVSVIYDGTYFQLISLNPSVNVNIQRQIITSTTTFTATKAGAHKVIVVAGGGSHAYPNGSSTYFSSGPGAGGASEKLVSLSLGQAVPVTIGAGGVYPTTLGNDGGSGGTSSFGAYCSATGGAGGHAMGNGYALYGATGGSGSGGDINHTGGNGGPGSYPSGGTTNFDGSGGPSIFGGSYGAGAQNRGQPGHNGIVIVEWVG